MIEREREVRTDSGVAITVESDEWGAVENKGSRNLTSQFLDTQQVSVYPIAGNVWRTCWGWDSVRC